MMPGFILGRPSCLTAHCGANIPRRHLTVSLRYKSVVQAAKGFGSDAKPTPKKDTKKKKVADTAEKKVRATDKKAVRDAVKEMKGGMSRPVDPREAAKGRLDQVQVQDWGSGDREDLGNLKVASITNTSARPDDPLYQVLARRLETLERNGELAVAQAKGSPPLPPYERWSFRKRRYLQFLVDQFSVHHMIEAAIMAGTGYRDPEEDAQDQAAAAWQEAEYGGGDPLAPDPVVNPGPQEEDGVPLIYSTPASRALSQFMFDAGLDRSSAIAYDLDSIMRASKGDAPVEVEPSQQAASHADYMRTLALASADPEATESKCESARLRLLAHVYALRVTHLTTGMRIGATALEKLNLVPIKATQFYDGYPDDFPDPLGVFIGALNSAGTFLGAEQREELMAELPSAFQKTSLHLSSLAHED